MLEEIYDHCLAQGLITTTSKNISKIEIRTLLSGAAKSKQNVEEYYLALCSLVTAFLNIQGIECSDEQALFATICIKFPSLELDWNLLERLRYLHEQGNSLNLRDWSMVKISLDLMFNTLEKEINSQL